MRLGSISRRVGTSFARFVGTALLLWGAWVFLANVFVGPTPNGWGVYLWILGSGLAGALGGLAFLASFDGPLRLRTRTMRMLGWVGMLVGVSLPTSLGFLLVPIVVLALPTFLIAPEPGEGVERSLRSE